MTDITERTILFLGDADSPLLQWLKQRGETVLQTCDKITPAILDDLNIGFLISYGYRHILTQDILTRLPGKAINLHISYLPWNRGADPNLWSFVDNTPKGVTIHYLDEGLDTGDIIVQREVSFDVTQETLASSYSRLHAEIQNLFQQHWEAIKHGRCGRKKQVGKGSSHQSKDKEIIEHCLIDGWNTSLSQLLAKIEANQS